MTTEDKFKAAVNIIRSLPKDGPYQPSHDMMLKFYGLYKQAVEGPCTEPKPAFYEMVKGYKWRAWNNLGDMSKTDAMNCYVDELKKIIETMAYTENVANFIDALGPFYEFIDIPGMKLKNNIKGVPEDEEPNSNYGDGEDGVKSTLNGHLPLHKRNGTQECDSDSESDLTHLSSQNSSPHVMSVASNGPVDASLARELKEAGEEEEEEEDEASDQEEVSDQEEEEEDDILVVKVQQQENVTTHTVSLSPKAYSDSESDEEYSEPAETPDHLAQVDTGLAEQTWSSTQIHHLSNTQLSTEPSTTDRAALPPPAVPWSDLGNALTCGGGDQSHPGGLQMTPRQIQQGNAGGSRQVSRTSTVVFLLPLHPGSFFQSGGGSGGSGGGGGGWGGANLTEDVNAQLVVVLRRLQTDMESVLHRLNTLETLTVTQHHTVCRQCQGGSGSIPINSGRTEPSWWPFPELSPRSTFFLLVWPLILHGGLKLLLLLRSRRRRS
ncbi:LOW QUALITY PROTEIN: acyl-CoA-binding domain-containing protein 5-like [Procambarus clarkii]|uniref:LOW QUALITY PROTEIN: acyl-CoA-binding domain-containing protein 5-like n=1 Tax=Procambarus clarkii TaxID=6728 RepID=UPI003744A870